MVRSFSLLRVILFILPAAQQMSKMTDTRNIPNQGILSKHTDDWCLLFSQRSYHSCDLSWLQWHFCPWGFSPPLQNCVHFTWSLVKSHAGRIFPLQDCISISVTGISQAGLFSDSKCYDCPKTWASSLLATWSKLRSWCQAVESSAQGLPCLRIHDIVPHWTSSFCQRGIGLTSQIKAMVETGEDL